MKTQQDRFEELIFVLSGRQKATFVVVGFHRYAERNRLLTRLKDRLKKASFFDLDLATERVKSLDRVLKERVPQHIKESEPGHWVVNVMGLENSLFENRDGRHGPSQLLSRLNFARENLFRFTYTTILWTDAYMAHQLKTQAKDLWSWVTYYFELKEEPKAFTSIPHNRPEPGDDTPHKAGMSYPVSRNDTLDELKERFENLNLSGEGWERVAREKVIVLNLLGSAYLERGNLKAALETYQTVLNLQERLGEIEEQIKSHENLGEIYWRRNDLALAGKHLKLSLAMREETQNGDMSSAHSTFSRLIEVAILQSDLNQARSFAERNLALSQSETDRIQEVEALRQLARVLRLQSQLTEARARLEECTQIIEELYGEGADLRLTGVFHDLAQVYRELGKKTEARELLERVLDTEERVYGNRDHYQTAISEAELGSLLLETEPDKAKALLDHAAKTVREKLGPEHPYTHNVAKLAEEARREK